MKFDTGNGFIIREEGNPFSFSLYFLFLFFILSISALLQLVLLSLAGISYSKNIGILIYIRYQRYSLRRFKKQTHLCKEIQMNFIKTRKMNSGERSPSASVDECIWTLNWMISINLFYAPPFPFLRMTAEDLSQKPHESLNMCYQCLVTYI